MQGGGGSAGLIRTVRGSLRRRAPSCGGDGATADAVLSGDGTAVDVVAHPAGSLQLVQQSHTVPSSGLRRSTTNGPTAAPRWTGHELGEGVLLRR